MKTHKENAEYFRLALLSGLTDCVSVMAWADSIINADAAPSRQAIEMATCPEDDIGRITSLLRTFEGPGDLKMSARAVIGLVQKQYQSGLLSIAEAIKALSKIGEASLLNNDFIVDVSIVADEVVDATKGVLTSGVAREGLTDLFARWSVNCEDWGLNV